MENETQKGDGKPMENETQKGNGKPTFLENVFSHLKESNLTHIEANTRLRKLLVKLRGDEPASDEKEADVERVAMTGEILGQLHDYSSTNRELMGLIDEFENLI